MRTFTFTDERGAKDELIAKVPEKKDPAYGMYVWPCAVVLSQYLWYHRKHLLVGKDVLELGAGTSLPGVVAAKCGKASSVTLTDDTHQPKCIENCKLTCAANSIQVENKLCDHPSASKLKTDTVVNVVGLSWGEVAPSVFGWEKGLMPFPDIILGSDCFFDEDIYEKLLFTIRYLIEGQIASQKPNTYPKFLCTYQVRSTKSTFDDLLLLWDLKCKEISLSDFEADSYDIARSGMPGDHTIKMLEITLK